MPDKDGKLVMRIHPNDWERLKANMTDVNVDTHTGVLSLIGVPVRIWGGDGTGGMRNMVDSHE